MLPRDAVEDAVAIHRRSYQLLRWLGDAIDSGLIRFTRAHDDATASDAAREWIEAHYDQLPDSVRPQPDQLCAFSNYFGSYVTTSFDLVENPGLRLERSSWGCLCPLCSHLVNISHLQPKRPSKRDKAAARERCVSRTLMLAVEEGLPLAVEAAHSLAQSHARSAAYSAYGLSLLERIRGSEGGPDILALWRMIAWKPEGSPIKGFTLKSEDIFDAEHTLVSAIARLKV